MDGDRSRARADHEHACERGRSSTALIALVCAAVVALGVAALFLLRPGEAPLAVLDAPARDAPSEPPHAGEVEGRAPASAAGERLPAVTGEAPTVVRGDSAERDAAPCALAIRSQDGLPVPGALVLARTDAKARRIASDDAALLAVSDATGTASFAERQCTSARRVFVVHDAYLPAETTLFRADGETHVLTLVRGHEQLFSARTTSGEPVPRFSVRMSRAAFSVEHASEPASQTHRAPAWNSAYAVHVATSDASGVARVSGLTAGAYAYELTPARGMAPVELSGTLGFRAAVPGDPIEIVFAPIYVAAVEALGDDILSCWFQTRSPWTVDGAPARLLNAEKKAIEADFPRAEVLVAALTAASDAPPVVDLMLRRTGLQKPTLRLVPLAEFSSPQLVDCGALPDAPLREVVLRAYDHELRPIHPSSLGNTFLLNPGGGFGETTAFPDEQGRFYVLDGSYQLFTPARHLRAAFIVSEQKIVPPAEVEVTFTLPLRRCSLEFLPPWGEPARTVLWKIVTSLGQLRVNVGDGEPGAVILPVGEATVFVSAFGVANTTAEVAVLPGSWDEVQLIRVVAE